MRSASRSRFETSLVACAAFFALGTGPRPARAQSPQVPAAEQLFREAHRLLAAGSVHEACLKFAESQRFDPGVGTLLNLALCHEREGRLASAWAEYSDVAILAARAGQKDREAFAREKCEELEPKLSRLVIVVRDHPADELVALDGLRIGPASFGTGIPVDPGAHQIETTAPGRPPWVRKLSVSANAGTIRVEIPRPAVELEPSPASGTGAVKPVVSPMSARRAIGYGVGATGVVATGFAVAYAVTSASRARGASDARAAHVESAAQEYDDQATLLRTYAIVAGAIAATAFSAGLYLVLTSRRSGGSKATVDLVPSATQLGASMNFVGQF